MKIKKIVCLTLACCIATQTLGAFSLPAWLTKLISHTPNVATVKSITTPVCETVIPVIAKIAIAEKQTIPLKTLASNIIAKSKNKFLSTPALIGYALAVAAAITIFIYIWKKRHPGNSQILPNFQILPNDSQVDGAQVDGAIEELQNQRKIEENKARIERMPNDNRFRAAKTKEEKEFLEICKKKFIDCKDYFRIDELFEINKTVNLFDGQTGETALELACKKLGGYVVDSLLAHGAIVRQEDINNCSSNRAKELLQKKYAEQTEKERINKEEKEREEKKLMEQKEREEIARKEQEEKVRKEKELREKEEKERKEIEDKARREKEEKEERERKEKAENEKLQKDLQEAYDKKQAEKKKREEEKIEKIKLNEAIRTGKAPGLNFNEVPAEAPAIQVVAPVAPVTEPVIPVVAPLIPLDVPVAPVASPTIPVNLPVAPVISPAMPVVAPVAPVMPVAPVVAPAIPLEVYFGKIEEIETNIAEENETLKKAVKEKQDEKNIGRITRTINNLMVESINAHLYAIEEIYKAIARLKKQVGTADKILELEAIDYATCKKTQNLITKEIERLIAIKKTPKNKQKIEEQISYLEKTNNRVKEAIKKTYEKNASRPLWKKTLGLVGSLFGAGTDLLAKKTKGVRNLANGVFDAGLDGAEIFLPNFLSRPVGSYHKKRNQSKQKEKYGEKKEKKEDEFSDSDSDDEEDDFSENEETEEIVEKKELMVKKEQNPAKDALAPKENPAPVGNVSAPAGNDVSVPVNNSQTQENKPVISTEDQELLDQEEAAPTNSNEDLLNQEEEAPPAPVGVVAPVNVATVIENINVAPVNVSVLPAKETLAPAPTVENVSAPVNNSQTQENGPIVIEKMGIGKQKKEFLLPENANATAVHKPKQSPPSPKTKKGNGILSTIGSSMSTIASGVAGIYEHVANGGKIAKKDKDSKKAKENKKKKKN